MKYTVEKSLKDFEFWAGAKKNVKYLTDEDIDHLEFILENLDGLSVVYSETEINDIFWFDTEWIAETLGWDSWDTLVEFRSK